MEGKQQQSEHAVESTPIMAMFESFRTELDDHHDRRQRIMLASRDITASSKKIIFSLQRIRTLGQPLPDAIAKVNQPYEQTIAKNLVQAAPDLRGSLNTYRYDRQISGGCQEYIEAALFQHYLTTATLMSHSAAAAQVRQLSRGPDDDDDGIELSIEDYVLGIYDFTGELMRFAITAMATSGALPVVPETAGRNILTDLRELRGELEGLNTRGSGGLREAGKKAEVMVQSVEKVEKALYGLVVRGAERPKGWMPEMEGGRGVEVEV